MIKDAKVDGQSGSQPGMVIVLNWIEEVKSKLARPTAR
jgi:hypothetical protein